MTGSWKVESTNTLIYHRHKLYQHYRYKKIAMYRLVYCEASSIRSNGVNIHAHTHTHNCHTTNMVVCYSFLSINRSHCSRLKRGYRMESTSMGCNPGNGHQEHPCGRPCGASSVPLHKTVAPLLTDVLVSAAKGLCDGFT